MDKKVEGIVDASGGGGKPFTRIEPIVYLWGTRCSCPEQYWEEDQTPEMYFIFCNKKMNWQNNTVY